MDSVEVRPCRTCGVPKYAVVINGKFHWENNVIWCGTEAEAQEKARELRGSVEIQTSGNSHAETFSQIAASLPAQTRPPGGIVAKGGYSYLSQQPIPTARAAAPVEPPVDEWTGDSGHDPERVEQAAPPKNYAPRLWSAEDEKKYRTAEAAASSPAARPQEDVYTEADFRNVRAEAHAELFAEPAARTEQPTPLLKRAADELNLAVRIYQEYANAGRYPEALMGRGWAETKAVARELLNPPAAPVAVEPRRELSMKDIRAIIELKKVVAPEVFDTEAEVKAAAETVEAILDDLALAEAQRTEGAGQK